ncbi:HGGxSTG domain-containing protein [Aureimonas phyllosphaerae]|uniref:HGGxSTG domain-containing protein n=1 Tax=Aureimonas phyllosphaerae TaxID=1166078 RepID=UPI003CCE84DB
MADSLCQAMFVPGTRRCRMHGGLSTGPKTAEGRTRIAEAQRRRWGARGQAS